MNNFMGWLAVVVFLVILIGPVAVGEYAQMKEDQERIRLAKLKEGVAEMPDNPDDAAARFEGVGVPDD